MGAQDQKSGPYVVRRDRGEAEGAPLYMAGMRPGEHKASPTALLLADLPLELLHRVCHHMMQKDLHRLHRNPPAMLLRRASRQTSALSNLPIQLQCSEDLGTISTKGALPLRCKRLLGCSTERAPQDGDAGSHEACACCKSALPFLVCGIRAIVRTRDLQGFGISLPMIRSLVLLDLSQSHVGLQDVTLLKHAVCLEELDLSHCAHLLQLFDSARCRRLRTAILRGCARLDDLTSIWACGSLRTLCIDGCTSLSSIRGIEACRELRALHASSCVSLTNLGGMGQCGKLVRLDMSRNRILNAPLGFGGDAAIEHVYLSCCSRFDDLQGVAGARLQELRLFGCSSLVTLRGIERCRAVEVLHLSCCDALRDIEGIRGMPRLHTVALGSCGGLIDLGVLASCSTLSNLGMGRCSGVSAMPDLSGTQVVTVDASACADLRCLRGLRGCCRLRHLDISHCRALTCVQDLAGCPELCSLNMENSIMIRCIRPLLALGKLHSVKSGARGYVGNL